MATFTPEELGQLIDEAKEQLKVEIIKDVRDRTKWYVEQALTESLGTELKEYVKAEIVPEFREHILGQKTVIIEHLVASANEIAVTLTDALVKKAVENMAVSYKRGAILKALFDA